MEKILLIGGGGHCKSVIDVIEQEGKFEIAGIIDNNSCDDILGYSVIGNDSSLEDLCLKYKYAFVTVGQIKSPNSRIELFQLLNKLKFIIPTIISPRAYIAKGVTIGDGTIIMHDVVINSDASIGKNCIINTKVLIEHDVTIKDNTHISTAAVINGGVNIGQKCFIGSNSTTKEYITIKDNSFIKAASLVRNDI